MSSSPPSSPGAPRWLLPCVLLTAILSLVSISMRVRVEQANQATTLAVEMDTVMGLAAAEGKSLPEAFTNLKAQGVTGVVLGEETIADLAGQGEVLLGEHEIRVSQPATLSSTWMLEERTERITRGLKLRFPNIAVQRADQGATVTLSLPLDIPMAMIRQTPVGLDPVQAKMARELGLVVVARAGNPQGVSGAYVRGTVDWLAESGAKIFLPQGDQVLGRRAALKDLAEGLTARDMLYASPEFTKIGGDANMLDLIPDRVVRLHSAQAAELDKLPLADAVDRYAKAARERNMRVLLLRPVTFASEAPLSDFADFARRITKEIQREGGDVGTARPFTDSAVPVALRVAIALSVVPTAFFVLSTLVRDRRLQLAGLGFLVLLALTSATRAGLRIEALLAAVVFPLAAAFLIDLRDGKNPLVEFLLVTSVSLVGGLAVAGLMNGLSYFIKADEFSGIKVAVFLPIVIAGVYFMARYANLRESLKHPVTWAAALIALGILAALAFMGTRTGNEGGGVSDLELRFRALLDATLFVRPRTKSFLIGHPAMFAGLALLIWQRRKGGVKLGVLTAMLLTVGMIGQTDVVNTLCHLHTPFLLSLLRNGVALVPGVILGTILWWAIRRQLTKAKVV